MADVLSFGEGLERIIGVVSTFEKPALIAIYSPGANHGKSYLRKALMGRLYDKGHIFTGQVCDIGLHNVNAELITKHDGHIFEVAGVFSPVNPGDRQIMDAEVNRLVGKKVDYHVFIYNPRIANPDIYAIGESVDLVVSNPNAVNKNLV